MAVISESEVFYTIVLSFAFFGNTRYSISLTIFAQMDTLRLEHKTRKAKMKIKRQGCVEYWRAIAFLFLVVSLTYGVQGKQRGPYLEWGLDNNLSSGSAYDLDDKTNFSDIMINSRSIKSFTTFTADIPAFPGAEGAGMWSVGGRGGKVYEVTNLNDSGPGSLRDAVDAGGSRIVVFRVSGTIPLKSPLVIRNPYITIAGQTAPGDGICLKDFGLYVSTQHVIIRYIRSRPGDNLGIAMDSLTIGTGSYNVIIDHCSTSWGIDETLSVVDYGGGPLGNVSVQWCLITESLNCSVHQKGCHGFGSLIRGCYGNRCSFHHNLYAHHQGRCPRPGNYVIRSIDPIGFIFDFRNNVIYNWGGSHAGYNADGANGDDSITKMNFVGNYYKRGPNSGGGFAFQETTTCCNACFAGNSMNGSIPDDPWSLVIFRDFSDSEKKAYKQSEQIPVVPVATDDAETAYQRVLADAGATVPKRDEVDIRIINDVINGTGRIIDDEDEVGGWPNLNSLPAPVDRDNDGMPDDWETARGLNPNDDSDGSLDNDGDGYTNIEEYLNWLVQ